MPPIQTLRTMKLMMMTAENNNKYYEMREKENATFDVYYGRVGGFRSKATHPIAHWDRKVREKKAKGYTDQANSYDDAKPVTPLESMKLTIESVADNHVLSLIKRMMGADANTLESAFMVRHAVNDAVFNTYVRQQKNRKTVALWHSNRRDNWLSMLRTNPTLSPANAINTGKSSGYGIHFVDQFSHSPEDASQQGQANEDYLAIYEVHVGEQLELSQQEIRHVQLTSDVLKYKDTQYDSVFVRQRSGLQKNEFIVYNPAQCTLRYIVKIKA
ncbi:hypothetical protein [Spirosoma pollinicola]|uniref:NAD(+) ADP-ribosyltransferase n=1 Tax=Spirosoma pollinicola TaxID=2057025 RepID=A0A2K8Z0M0_9BACT|nr:hypothetical protein [Spirosoma pollinicola]AUD03432.1 hypothetical protein CWM47_17285 [Spirosoma pollinicola]